MAKRRIYAAAAAVIVILISADRAPAQEVADSLDVLHGRITVGTRVVVRDQAGRRTEGVLTAIDASGISLRVGDEDRQWREAEINELRRRGDSVRNGALIGLGVGVGAGVAGGLAMASWFANEGANAAGVFINVTALGAGIGALAGAGLDRLRQGETVLFRRPPPVSGSARRSVTLGPVLTPGVRALHVAVRF